MWVKICANTNLEDALAAAEFGADAVGFVFAASKRQMTAEAVGRISAEMPEGVERVGVFGAMPAEEIAAAVGVAGLHTVQLHGGYDQALTGRLRELLGERVAVIETVHWSVGDDEASAEVVRGQIEQLGGARVLVDAKVGGASGGTGVSFDWRRARGALAGHERLILAGGLRPENVEDAVRLLHPWGVDVASGVENSPGRKDLKKVREFIGRARGERG